MWREELLAAARPILFNTGMVQAIMREPLGGKTATRRAIKGYIPKDAVFGHSIFTPAGGISCRGTFEGGYGEKIFRMPCRVDDILYVRETWNYAYRANGSEEAREETGRYVYYADGSMSFGYWIDPDVGAHKGRISWRPSIHMPKEAARIFLKVEGVRVERLWDMKLDDFLAEGVALPPEAYNDPENAYQQARDIFKGIWDATTKGKQLPLYGWEANPWVWAIKFKRIKEGDRRTE